MRKITKKKTANRSGSNRKPADAAPRPTATEQTGFGLQTDVIEGALVTGERRGLLEDYFGPENYSQLRDLARDAATRSFRGGPRVLILPGIMGSTLARKRLANIEDILWVNPVEIALGKLIDLKLDDGASPYHAAGVILLAYLKMKLRLKIAGYDADFFAYDWRRSVAELGAALANFIQRDTATAVSLVTHSMGGLVARAALTNSLQAAKKLTRLIMLG